MFEVFQPTDGRPVFVTRHAWLARLLRRLFHAYYRGGLDYAKSGEGWTS